MFKSVNDGKLPERATKYSAGFDVFANEDMVIGAGDTKVIGLGIYLDEKQIEELHDRLRGTGFNERLFSGLYIELHPRSSLRAKGLGGGVGIIDMDYREQIKIVITNPRVGTYYLKDSDFPIGANGETEYTIKRGDKIGQLILKRHEGWLLPSQYTKDEERNGGFGSTGE